MLLIQKLNYFHGLTKNEELAAQYIYKNIDRIESISINDIASQTFTSPSTTVRLAQKLGFKGFKELKSKLMKEQRYLNNNKKDIDANKPFTAHDSLSSISMNIADLLSDSLHDTLNLIDYNELEKIINIINTCNHINIYGFTHALSSSYDFKYKMASIKKQVTLFDSVQEFAFASDFTNNDTVHIFLSYTGETQHLISTMKELKTKHVPIIAITSIGDNTMSKLADYCLEISTKEKIHSKIATYASNESFHYLLDIIYSCVFQKNYDENYKHKVDNAHKYDQTRFSLFDIIKE